MDITLHNITKHFGQFHALNNINLDIASGELIALLGPSGSGKTTLLRIIAGLEFADAGAVYFGGENVIDTPVHQRQIGFVFQHYALFKNMTVRDNVSFGQRVRKDKHRPSKQVMREQADELLELVQLQGLGDRYPHQLSGGQRQRVALARALAISPKVLLLDEPFGALDAKVRKSLRQWLRDIHHRTGVTTLFVTHDQEEALELADRVVIMSGGNIAQVGSVEDVYERPASPLVFDFLGSTNRIEVERKGDFLFCRDERIANYKGSYTGKGSVYVRPGDLRIARAEEDGIQVVFQQVQRNGPLVRATATVTQTGAIISLDIPHLHYDVNLIQPGATQRLKLLQFSLFDDAKETKDNYPDVPVLVGRERIRLA
ncbi:MAG: sulfate/molybdate ABC transporter ATP-binding protein [Pseudomonadota bacterium]|nr:sulfate/molybdate ABC transporter ATP-binding protein [Pseudomonadota bacterium]